MRRSVVTGAPSERGDQFLADAVVLVPYEPAWPARFEAERDRILGALGTPCVVEQVGSTAIANMKAKPYIDILVGHHGDEATCLQGLAQLRYTEEGAREGHRWLCWPSPERREFIVHLVPHQGAVWVARLTFRDRLRQSAELREAYVSLKRSLAADHPADLDAYTAGKAAFVRAVVSGQ